MRNYFISIELLQAPLIINDYVSGEENCNYEKYLLEFTNKSNYFLSKSKGKKYQSPLTENNGECDCESEFYKMDFKLFLSKTVLQALSILSFRIAKDKNGAIITFAPKEKDKSIMATQIHAVLRNYDLHKLKELRKRRIKKQGIENDILGLLKTMDTRKNIFLFFPYIFSLKKHNGFDKDISQIIQALQSDFKSILHYRTSSVNNYDTYFSFIYDKFIIITKVNKNCFKLVDCVELNSSLIYLSLLRYNEFQILC